MTSWYVSYVLLIFIFLIYFFQKLWESVRPLSFHQTGLNQVSWFRSYWSGGTGTQRDEQHKEVHCSLNPGSKIWQFWWNNGALMSGKVVAVREASLSLCLGYVKAPGLSLVYLPLICSTEPSTWKSGPRLTSQELFRSSQSLTWVTYSWMDQEWERGRRNYLGVAHREKKERPRPATYWGILRAG